MARSLLASFVSGTRQMLVAQLFISVGAVALAGWTLGVTNDLIRERDRLKERVIQLEETLATADVVVPPTAQVVNPPQAENAYPPSVNLPADAPASAGPIQAEQDQPPRAESGRNFGQMFTELFAPAPPLRTVVLHARSEDDARAAQPLAEQLAQTAGVRVAVNVMAPRDPRESGYSYFDGRQSRTSANVMQQFHDIARRNEVAAWSAQLRGVALPAQGEFSADRLDIVLPPLPAASALQPQPINPGALQTQPQQQQPTLR